MKDYIDLVGRLFLGLFFAFQAYDIVAHISTTKAHMTEFSILWAQDMLLWGSVLFLILGSIMLSVGYRSRLAAFLLFLYWIPVTFIAYAFWNESGTELRVEGILFMQRMAIAGALMLIMAHGTGRFAVKKLLATARTPG